MAPTSHVELLITHLADLSYVKCTPDGQGGTVCAKHELPLPLLLLSVEGWSPLVHHLLFAVAMFLMVVIYGGYACRSRRRRRAAAAAAAAADAHPGLMTDEKLTQA